MPLPTSSTVVTMLVWSAAADTDWKRRFASAQYLAFTRGAAGSSQSVELSVAHMKQNDWFEKIWAWLFGQRLQAFVGRPLPSASRIVLSLLYVPIEQPTHCL